jgi:D-hydroxyproline dehydrogenase subunit gamma
MFRRLPDVTRAMALDGVTVAITIDGHTVTARLGDSVAAAMFAAGLDAFRTTPVGGSERGPYCMMGTCFDCLARIDGRCNQQACLILVREGMIIERQHGMRKIGSTVSTGSS